MSTATETLDPQKAEIFAGRVVGILNDGAIALGLSIGHQARLFDCLAALPPSTSREIAAAANLQERYVREWLGAMTTGGILDYEPSSARYKLPAEHAVSLTTAAGPGNLAAAAQLIALLAPVESLLLDAFSRGGGVGYEHYPRFAQLMREDSATVLEATLLDRVVPLIPGLHERLLAGASVADIGCGAGRAINLLARAYPASTFTGFDFSGEAIGIARSEAADWGLSNARFEERDAALLDIEAAFDAVTAFDAIHDQARPRAVLAAIHRALKPGGAFLMADIASSSNLEDNVENPLAAFLYTISYMHCMTVSLAQGGEGLGAMWGEQKARELLADAGFEQVEVARVEGDVFNNYFIARK